jgi:hypothetical protein
MGKGYDKTDAAKDTGTSSSKVSESWHQARDDSGARSGKDKGSFDKAPSWAKDSEKGPSFFPKGKK